tara:strand:- start:1203 stop:1469 length:267 start_codon:yes stop_codon:yes gene_type:complete
MKSKSQKNIITHDKFLQIQGIRTRLDLIYKEIDKLHREIPVGKLKQQFGEIYDSGIDMLDNLDDIIEGRIPKGNTSFSTENDSYGGTI